MEQLKIGIVEDDLLIAESIAVTLQQIGYRSTNPVRNYKDALKMINTENPDLLLIDIGLDGELDGIDLASRINQDYGLPFIFLTANSDRATVNRAKEVKPYAYLVKPFNEHDLYSSIEIAFNNFNDLNNSKSAEQAVTYLKDVIFIKEGELFHKLDRNDIFYVSSENVYLNLFTAKRNFTVRTKLDDFVKNFAQGDFFQIHRSYAINLKHLETINSMTVNVAGKEIPLNKIYRQQLLEAVKSIKKNDRQGLFTSST
jgi:DNA-binding LytR/AlgR family response regulator